MVEATNNTSFSLRYINKHGVVSHEHKLSLFPLLKKHPTKHYFVGNSDNTSFSPRYINKHGVVSHEQQLSLSPTLEKASDETLFCRK